MFEELDRRPGLSPGTRDCLASRHLIVGILSLWRRANVYPTVVRGWLAAASPQASRCSENSMTPRE
jgi:hypothetical protein